MPREIKVTFEYERETPGTWRYKEVDGGVDSLNPLIGTLYIRKAAMSSEGLKAAPKAIEVTVTITE